MESSFTSQSRKRFQSSTARGRGREGQSRFEGVRSLGQVGQRDAAQGDRQIPAGQQRQGDGRIERDRQAGDLGQPTADELAPTGDITTPEGMYAFFQ